MRLKIVTKSSCKECHISYILAFTAWESFWLPHADKILCAISRSSAVTFQNPRESEKLLSATFIPLLNTRGQRWFLQTGHQALCHMPCNHGTTAWSRDECPSPKQPSTDWTGEWSLAHGWLVFEQLHFGWWPDDPIRSSLRHVEFATDWEVGLSLEHCVPNVSKTPYFQTTIIYYCSCLQICSSESAPQISCPSPGITGLLGHILLAKEKRASGTMGSLLRLSSELSHCCFCHVPLGKVSHMAKPKAKGQVCMLHYKEILASVWTYGGMMKWDSQFCAGR